MTYPDGFVTSSTVPSKFKVRQLEPVLQMWQPNFSLGASAPPGHEPVQCGTKWHYQTDQCPACMMARMGSDVDVLFALFAGMVGRFNSKAFTTMDAIRNVAGWDSAKSKRLRFVRYWVRKTSGESPLLRACDLGMDLKRLRAQWKHEQRRHVRAHSRTRMQETPVSPMPRRSLGSSTVPAHQRTLSRSASTRTVRPRRNQKLTAPSLFDPKLDPNPRPPDTKLMSQAEDLGFEMPGMRKRAYTIPHNQEDIHPALRNQPRLIPSRSSTHASRHYNQSTASHNSERTIKPDDTMSLPTVRLPQRQTSDKRSAPFQIRRRPVPQPTVAGSTRGENFFLNPPASTISRQSFATTAHTIASYTGGPSSRAGYIDPLDNPIYDHIETQEERVEKYRRLLSSHPDPDPFAEYEDDNASVFPKPQRQSMYSAFGDVGFDSARFDVIDEELAEDEIEDWERGEPEDDEAVQGCEVNVGMILGKGRYRRDSDASVRSNDFY
ncbi:hypothetical protein BKA58DRAFT_153635 [Alternaria rosae]|uniref:uncharacterized protein n=1 Tax=Alternaria rosae TaxID=1187941 RepID=UPI001E8CAA86|nr:uncharacterized protein BKA58DRAFT_153635 [Alternaria rosae]KAH6872830.1 hypothetical protein BKA58DRAFT_153635 [Alternaria rosae]